MDDTRDRVGSLGSTKLRLAKSSDVPYQRSYRTVAPASTEIPGADGKVAADPSVRYWHVDDWSGGEGEPIWRPGLNAYSKSTNVRPDRFARGFQIGPKQSFTVDDLAAVFSDCVYMAVAQGTVWAFGDVNDDVYRWDHDNTRWVSTPTVANIGVVQSVAHGLNDWVYVSIASPTKSIKRFKADGTVQTHYASWASYTEPVAFSNGELYGLVNGDLYRIDQTTATTRTLVADTTNEVDSFIVSFKNVQRMVATDVGVAWYHPTDDGLTNIFEYNAYTDSHSVIGQLPQWAWPDSIMFNSGFIFISFRTPQWSDVSGFRFPDPLGVNASSGAYIYYQRGAQRGVLGPLRSVALDDAETYPGIQGISLGGVIGDEIVMHFDKALWAYNLTSGGIFQISKMAGSHWGSGNGYLPCVTFGAEIFTRSKNGADYDACERTDYSLYSIATSTADLGRYDFGWLGIEKILHDVTVIADIPTGCTVKIATRAEAGAFTTHADTMDDTETSHTFVISDGASSLTGRDFEVRLILTSYAGASTPVVRSVTARATTAVKQTEWTLNVDVGTPLGGRDGDSADRHSILADLQTMAEANRLYTFTDPWHRSEYGAAETFDVIVEEVTMPDAAAEGTQYARVVLRALSPAYSEGVPVG